MNFTSQLFIFIFLPICLASYFTVEGMEKVVFFGRYIRKFRIKDLLLISFSLVFYLWYCFPDVFRLCFYIIGVYGAGLWVQNIGRKKQYLQVFEESENSETSNTRKIPMSIFSMLTTVFFILFILIHFKYKDVLVRCWNFLLGDDLAVSPIVAPLGISFITFSAISYLIDIYKAKAQAGNLLDCMLYLSFFPKVVSGPLILWKDFKAAITDRRTSLENIVDGLNRIMIGFIKKLILADQFGICVSRIPLEGIDMISAWGSALLYMLQIYYDFSSYSDIAIGISRLFGFRFKENFNFPYRSKSLSEFWRRWHISLGTWFREYVYFPMGGSRRGQSRTLFNLAVVFGLTGLWHGSTKNYILWGAVNGGVVLLERLIQDKRWYQKVPGVIRWLITMGITFFCWQFFRFASLSDVFRNTRIMCGILRFDEIYYTWEYYFDKQIMVFAIIGIVGAILFGDKRIQEGYRRFTARSFGFVVQEIVLLLLFCVAILFVVNSDYYPFIYFQY